MANTYDITTYIQALETAKAAFAAASKGVDVRESIVNQCEAIIDIAEQIIADLNDAVDMSLAVPDTSLSQQGKPAEARATGIAIAEKADKDYAVIEDRAAIGPDSLAAIFSTASGIGAVTGSANGQLAIGQFNVEDSDSEYLFIAGNGNDANARHNAAVIDTTGNAWFAGSAYVGGSDLAHGSELATKAYADAIVQGFDSYPQDGSSNGVTSDGVYDATENAKSSVKNWVTSQEYATTSAMNTALGGKVNTSDVSNSISTDAASTSKVPSVKAIKDYVDSFTPSGSVDQTIVQNSTNAVSGGAVYAALAGKQDALTIDTELSNSSPNPVKNSVIFTALSKKFDTLDVSNNMTTDGSSTTKVPCCKAIKKYVDDAIAAAFANS